MKRFKILAMLALLVLMVSLMPSIVKADGPATVDNETKMPIGVTRVILDHTPNNTLFGYGSKKASAKQKALKWLTTLDLHQPETPYDYVYSASAFRNYNDGRVETYYNNSHVRLDTNVCGSACNQGRVDGDTWTKWTGCVPSCYPNRMKLTEYWKFYGSSVTVTIGSSGSSGTWSVTTDTVTYDSGLRNSKKQKFWSLRNLYSGVFGQGFFLNRVDDVATGLSRFSGVDITAVGSHSCYFGSTYVC